ncbi:hypothetical protein BVIET440_10003 [Burkholderia vietnamiensis]|nr:hypothetical protein BVI434_20020 [Burkholderia vietnamiensis]CAG9206091.1 hypothetical protein BVI1335_1810022 [Burkholderia vietnamiensis]CAG9213109.1 hypothetical protein BVI2075_560004 [Burkholderia vietnamiensis]
MPMVHCALPGQAAQHVGLRLKSVPDGRVNSLFYR